MPVRQIPKNFSSLTGRFASRKVSSKIHRSMSFESSLELDLECHFEFDQLILNFEERPVHVSWRNPGD